MSLVGGLELLPFEFETLLLNYGSLKNLVDGDCRGFTFKDLCQPNIKSYLNLNKLIIHLSIEWHDWVFTFTHQVKRVKYFGLITSEKACTFAEYSMMSTKLAHECYGLRDLERVRECFHDHHFLQIVYFLVCLHDALDKLN